MHSRSMEIMFQRNIYLIFLLLEICVVPYTWAWWWGGGCGSWSSWSHCSSDCFGMRYRSRSGCSDQSQRCNENCYNGGTYHGYKNCACTSNYQGTCCESKIVYCGNPGQIENGRMHGSNFYNRSSVSYTCDRDYTLTDGSVWRTCQDNGFWSGTKPRCAFSNACRDKPCMNDGTCINGIEQYTCQCKEGWGGQNCEKDLVSPSVTGCHSDMVFHTADDARYANWTPPVFYDPFGKPLTVTTNYPKHGSEFPWGDFTVQYVALKKSNGLSKECKFVVKIRPFPCEELETPANGYLVCTNWKTDYGKFCRGYCKTGYTTDPSAPSDQLYVCGASGVWAPSQNMFDCVFTTANTLKYSFNYCSDVSKVSFLTSLKSSNFESFCSTFEKDCSENNIKISCS